MKLIFMNTTIKYMVSVLGESSTVKLVNNRFVTKADKLTETYIIKHI